MAEVEVSVGANTKALQRGLQDSQRLIAKFKQDATRMQILESDNKVKKNVVGLASDLSNITNISGLATVAAARLGDTFKNSLSTGLLIGLGSAFVTMGAEGVAAMRETDAAIGKVRDNISGLASADMKGAISAMREFKTQLTEAQKTQVDGGLGDVGQNMRDFFGGVGSVMNGGGFFDARDKRLEHQQELQRGIVSAKEQAVKAANQEADIAELRAAGEDEAAAALEMQVKHARELADLKNRGMSADGIAAVQRRQAAENTEREAKAAEKKGKVDEAQQKVAEQRLQRGVKALDDQITDGLKSPSELSDERRQRQHREREERKIINRDLQKQDTDLRNQRKNGIDAGERQKMLKAQLDENKKARDPGAESLKNIEVILKEIKGNIGAAG